MTPNISQVTQSMIDTQKILCKIYNDAAIANYNLAMASYNDAIGRGFLQTPIPKPPMLMVADVAAITQAEEHFAGTQPSFVTWYQYVPIAPPVPPPTPLSMSAVDTGYPGMFELNGDEPSIPAGQVWTDVGTGHSYRKVVVSHSPFAPGGQVCLWQQIS